MSASDIDLLRDYARKNSQDAFAELVKRHLNLVFSAALRQVRSPQLAEEVAQSTFTDLARNAARLAPNTILTAWLYQVSRRTAIDVVRREARRQLREQIATEMNAMNANASDWTHIEPLLDEAMHALEETDRAAVLLRYFENKSLREVGATLGTSDDAAQKRVSRAVERLREFFDKRGVTVGASGLVVMISANAVQAAPVGLAALISAAAALAGAAITCTTTATATKAIVMTTLQKAAVTAALAAAVGAGIYEAHRASVWQSQVQALRQQQAPLADQIQQFQRERDNAIQKLAALSNQTERSNSDASELLKLRGEVTRLRGDSNKLAQLNPRLGETVTLDNELLSLQAQANLLKQKRGENSDQCIPEMKYLKPHDLLFVAMNADLRNNGGVRYNLGQLRIKAKDRFAPIMAHALRAYANANGGQLPDELSQLTLYFESPVDDAVLSRYQLLRSGNIGNLTSDDYVVAERPAPNQIIDSVFSIGLDQYKIKWTSQVLDGRGMRGGTDGPEATIGIPRE